MKIEPQIRVRRSCRKDLVPTPLLFSMEYVRTYYRINLHNQSLRYSMVSYLRLQRTIHVPFGHPTASQTFLSQNPNEFGE